MKLETPRCGSQAAMAWYSCLTSGESVLLVTGLEGKRGRLLSSSSLCSSQVLSAGGLMVGSLLHIELRKAKLRTKSSRTEHLPAKRYGLGFSHLPSPSSPAFQHHVFKPPSSKAHQRGRTYGGHGSAQEWTPLDPLRSKGSTAVLEDLLPTYFLFSTALLR